MKLSKPNSYYDNIAWLMVFDILMRSGEDLMSIGDEETMPIDLKKQDIYKAEKKLEEFKKKIEPFKDEVTQRTKRKVKSIITDVIMQTMKHEHISPQIIAIQLLFAYFVTYEHKKMPEEFSYFANANNYYSVLDKLESSQLIDANRVYKTVNQIIERNR